MQLSHVTRRLKEMPNIAANLWKAEKLHLFYILLCDWLGRKTKATPREHLNAALDWIVAACEVTTESGGISAGYSLMEGWLPPYLETTGYSIPTLYEAASLEKRPDLADLATRLAEWEIYHQTPSGGIGGEPGFGGVPVVFDTGQVLFGLLCAYRKTNNTAFLNAANKAGKFLLDSISENGCFTKNLFLNNLHTYNVRVSWGLLLLYEQTGELAYRRSAEANLNWTLKQQKKDGLFRHNTFRPGEPILTHLLGYTVQGLTECGFILQREDSLAGVHLTLARLLAELERKGTLAGTYSQDWFGDYSWTCLTGNCQLAIVFKRLAPTTSDSARYEWAFHKLLNNVKATQNLNSNHLGIRGGIKGSHPIRGGYRKYEFLNWATKFFVDALLLEIHGTGGTFG